MSISIEPFRIATPESALKELRTRLRHTRWPGEITGSDWRYGTSVDYLQALCRYWGESYAWREREAAINQFEQYLADFDGHKLHFLHRPSANPNAIPLLLLHGWPGSFVEFLKCVVPLTDPQSVDADPADAFHVVCPSLPGFGFSDPATQPGMNVELMARWFARLMSRLGYERYITQGGDWGSVIAAQLARCDPDHCVGIHLNTVLVQAPRALENLGETEREALEQLQRLQKTEMGYYHIQSTRPQTLAFGLNDSPAGLAAWIVDKFRSWSQCHGDLESVILRDELLDILSIYWFTGSIGSACRLYFEELGNRVEQTRVTVPTGIAVFPGEPFRAPRVWVERDYNVVSWNELPRGGHFAALETPELLVDDLRGFARRFR